MSVLVMPTVLYKVPVTRYTGVHLHCPNDECTDRDIAADFDEVQRIILCPTCGSEVVIPEEYRGTP